MFSHSNTVSLFFRRDVTVEQLGDELTASCTPKCCCSFRALPFWGSHLPRPLVTRGGDGFCQPALLAYACWILSQNGRTQEKWDEMRWDEMRWVHHSCFCSTIYIIYYINIYDYIVANHRIICSMYSNHKDQFITTLWTCLYSFLSSGLEVAAEFGWSKWPRCCGHLGSGATEDPGILATWDLQNFCSHFLDLNWILPWTVKIPWFDEVENWPRFLGVFTVGFRKHPWSEVCNGRRIDLQADLSDLQGIGVPEQHLRNYLSTSKSHFHIWTPIWSYFRFRLGSTSEYDLIQCDKPNKPSPSPCLWVLC